MLRESGSTLARLWECDWYVVQQAAGKEWPQNAIHGRSSLGHSSLGAQLLIETILTSPLCFATVILAANTQFSVCFYIV